MAELSESNNQITQAMESRQMAESEASRLKASLERVETDRQNLQQEVQDLTGLVAYLRNTAFKDIEAITSKVRLEPGVSVLNSSTIGL